MAILLGYTTALDYWRSCSQAADRSLRADLLGTLDERKSATAQVRSELSSYQARRVCATYLKRIPGSHAIIIGKQVKPIPRTGTAHVFSELPACSCVCADHDFKGERVFVSSPEFCFLQMATVLSLEQLIVLGYELCGTYACLGDATCYGVHPLSSPRKIGVFLGNATGSRGVVKARRALRYILANSASPMETALSMLLTLPHLLGGYGIEAPRLNHRIDLSASLKRTTSHSFFVCDLYWEQERLAIEYDSDLAHAGINKTVQDAMRRSLLTGMGISVLSVTNPQIKNDRAFDQLAHVVAKRVGKRLRYDEREFAARRRKLRSALLFPSS